MRLRMVQSLKRPVPLFAGAALGAFLLLGVVELSQPHTAPAASASMGREVKQGIQTLRTFSEAFTAVAETVRPAVVSIIVEKRQTNPLTYGGFHRNNPFKGSPFEWFFQQPPQGSEAPIVRGGGTGIVVTEDGMILTNNHVVEDADTIKVTFSDDREFTAKVQGVDPRTDLAVIKIDAKGLKTARLGDSDATRVGEWVIAMGNPYGFDYTVTAGIVSAKGRKVVGGQQYEDFIQTDASINPGNSGGPLLNLDGEVIGINTMIAGIGTGIGFAIPSNLARDVSTQLVQSGTVVRPWLGVGIQTLTDDMAKSLKLDPDGAGVIISRVHEGSPAAKAGMQRGDVILDIDDKPVKNSDALIKAVLTHRVGDSVKVAVLREGKRKIIKVTTETMPDDTTVAKAGSSSRETAKIEKLGIAVQDLSQEMAKSLGLRASAGVIATHVASSSPVARAGIRPGDVILEVNRRPVSSVSQFEQAVDRGVENVVLFLISREGNTFFVAVRVS